jgi:4-diphosphocytidyl-2-C-methyl-D-erythritol kinase
MIGDGLILFAPAKLNLSLDVVGEDGAYHLLDGVMLEISLADRLLVRPATNGAIALEVTGPFKNGIPTGEDNLAAKAVRLFYSATGASNRGLKITIEKNIPAEAGLGGGSADAAALLKGLNGLAGNPLSMGELLGLGASLGADIPFCLTGGCARARGRGERLKPLKALPPCFFVVARPKAGVSTRAAFALYDRREKEPARPDIPAMQRAIEKGDLGEIGRAMGNVFEELGAPKEIPAIKSAMLRMGALGAAMTGTGAAIAALFAEEEAAVLCKRALAEITPAVFVARPSSP